MSTVFRVEKNSNYTVMSNYHIQDHRISWKAKGLLSTILSLPPNWDYTLQGLATIAKDGVDSTRAGINELEDSGYVYRTQTRDERGRMSKNEYVVYERPEDNPEYIKQNDKKTEIPLQLKEKNNSVVAKNGYNSGNSPSWGNPTTVNDTTGKPLLENPITVFPLSENPMQLNTKILNTKILNTKGYQSYQSINEPEDICPEKKIDEIDEDKISEYKSLIHQNVDYEELIAQNEKDKPKIDEIIDNMLEMMCCTASTIRIGGLEQSTSLVRARIMKIDSSCIEYILLCLQRNTKKVRNIKAYLRTVIFNAPSTMDSFYDSEVNNALYGNINSQ